MKGFNQYSETSRLKKVIIGRAKDYKSSEAYVEIVNEDQKTGLPDEESLLPEFDAFKKALEERGVEVLIPEYIGGFVYDQLTPRDIGVTIGSRFLICNMKKSSRRYEVAGIFSHLNALEGPGNRIIVPRDPEILLEGGDIIIDKGRILLGISQRSNMAGLEFLKSEFGDEFQIEALHCRSLEEGANVLHLDCTFNPVGENYALIHEDGFKEIPEFLRTDYEWIKVDAKEQHYLATNVLSIDKNTVISRNNPACKRVNEEMRQRGIEVIEIPFDGAPSTGGSVRCCSLPLLRE